MHYEDTERGREALRKDAALRERNDKLDEAAYALDTAYYSGLCQADIYQSTNQRQTLYAHQLFDDKLMSAMQPGIFSQAAFYTRLEIGAVFGGTLGSHFALNHEGTCWWFRPLSCLCMQSVHMWW